MTALQLVHLTKKFSQASVLKDIHLQVESGELVAVLGPSGVGKSTLLRLIAGLLAPDEGDILFDEQSVRHVPPQKRSAALVFQENQLFPFMTVAQNIAFGLKIQGLRRQALKQRIDDVLSLIHLTGYEKRYPHQLSGGQRQRVALARAIAIQPKILLLDEPFSQLEVELRETLRQDIKTLQAHLGITTLFVTHDQKEAVSIADQIALLMDGEIVQFGAPANFYESPKTEQIARFWGATNILAGQKCGPKLLLDGNDYKFDIEDNTSLADGTVLAMIRPELIQVGTSDHNTLNGVVQTWHYEGVQSRGVVQCEGLTLHLSSPPYIHFKPQDAIAIHIQANHIWLMPKDTS